VSEPEISFRLNPLLDFFHLLVSREPARSVGRWVARLGDSLPPCPAEVRPEGLGWRDIGDYADLVRAVEAEGERNESWHSCAQMLRDSEPIYRKFLAGWREELKPAAASALEEWREDFRSRRPLESIQRLLRKRYPYDTLIIHSTPLNPTMSYSPGLGEIFCGSEKRPDGAWRVLARISLFIGHEVCHILMEEASPTLLSDLRFAELVNRWQHEYPALEYPRYGIPEECCHAVMNRVAVDTGEMAYTEMKKMMGGGLWADCTLYDIIQAGWDDFQRNDSGWASINDFLIDCALEFLSGSGPSGAAGEKA